jgi:hypothetical protein
MSTVPANAPTTLEGLKAAYVTAMEASIAKYPAQAANRDHNIARLAKARLVKLTRRFYSKGGHTDVSKGTNVLDLGSNPFFPEHGHTFFVPKTDGSLSLSSVPANWLKAI